MHDAGGMNIKIPKFFFFSRKLQADICFQFLVYKLVTLALAYLSLGVFILMFKEFNI